MNSWQKQWIKRKLKHSPRQMSRKERAEYLHLLLQRVAGPTLTKYKFGARLKE